MMRQRSNIFSIDSISKLFSHVSMVCMNAYLHACVCARTCTCTCKWKEKKDDFDLLPLFSAIVTGAVLQLSAELAYRAGLANQLPTALPALLSTWWNSMWAAIPTQCLHNLWASKALVLMQSQQAPYPLCHLPNPGPIHFHPLLFGSWM